MALDAALDSGAGFVLDKHGGSGATSTSVASLPHSLRTGASRRVDVGDESETESSVRAAAAAALDALRAEASRLGAAAASSLAESYETKRNTQVTRNEGELPSVFAGGAAGGKRRGSGGKRRRDYLPSVNDDDDDEAEASAEADPPKRRRGE